MSFNRVSRFCLSAAQFSAAGLYGLPHASNLGIEVKERVQAPLQLGFDLLARALDGVHGHVGLVSIGQLKRCVLNSHHFALGK